MQKRRKIKKWIQKLITASMLLLSSVSLPNSIHAVTANENQGVSQVVPFVYSHVSNFSYGVAIVRTGSWETGRWGLIDASGNTVLPLVYDSLTISPSGFIIASRDGTVEQLEWGSQMMGSRWGVLDTRGREVIPFNYSGIFIHDADDVAVVTLGDWTSPNRTQGLIELSTGRVIIPTGIYTGISQISEGRAAVWIGDPFGDTRNWGVVDLASGELITGLSYTFIHPFREGFTTVSVGTGFILGQWGFINRYGQEITPLVFDQNSGPFIGGLARVSHNGLWGLINTSGDFVLPPIYDGLWWWDMFAMDPDINFINISLNGQAGILSREGEVVIQPNYDSINIVNNQFAVVGIGEWSHKLFGLLDIETGHYILPIEYSAISLINDELAVVSSDFRGLVGIVNFITGEVVVPPVFDQIHVLADNLLATLTGGHWEYGWDGWMVTGGYWGVINNLGQEIISPRYNSIRLFSDNLVAVAIGNPPNDPWAPFIATWGLIDRNGNTILPVEYDHISWVQESHQVAFINRGGSWGPPDEYSGGHNSVISGGYWGIINADGNVIIPAEVRVDSLRTISEGLIAAEINGNWGFLSIASPLIGNRPIPAIIDEHAVYDHTPNRTWLSFTPNPTTLQNVSTPVQAISIIQQLVSSLTPAERADPIFLTNTTLHIENLLARGTTTRLASDGVISWTSLQEGATTASEILEEALQALADYEVSPLRRLRQNVFFQQQGSPRELSVSFGEAGNANSADFDNSVVQSGFSSVTIHRDFVTDGASVEVRLVDATEDGEETSLPTPTDFSQIQDSLALALASINLPSVEAVMYLWAILVAIAIIVLYILLRAFKKYLRLWVPLSVVSLAIVANAYTLVLLGNEQQLPDSLQELLISVDITENLAVTLSLPVDTEDQDLVLLNQEGYIVPTRYNPSTGTLDSRISSSGYYRVIEHVANFTDIEHSAAIMQEAILWLGTRGIMAGSIEGNFYPNQPITRAEFTATVVNAFNLLDLGAQHNFLDVLPQDWFYTAVASAYEQDLVEGFVDQTFRPTWDMAKGQLIVVIGRILMEQMDYRVPDNVDQLLQDFTDIEDLPNWAIEAIALTNATNILIHRYDGLFASNTVMTRGDAAIVLYRLFSRIW